jgi:DNA-3-methyladenine glycosylase I
MDELNKRCPWCHGDALYERYHDEEWGKPLFDEHQMFEFLLLETFQAGLSWITVLRKRQSFRAVFHDFVPERVAQMDEKEVALAMNNPSIIRNGAKIRAAISNAQCVVRMHQEGKSLVDFFWSYIDHKPIQNNWNSIRDLPAKTALAEKISSDMKKLGFKFVGPTVIYAHMQATGMVNDHLTSCPSR